MCSIQEAFNIPNKLPEQVNRNSEIEKQNPPVVQEDPQTEYQKQMLEARNMLLYLKKIFPDPTEFLGVLLSDWPILRNKLLQWQAGKCDINGLRPYYGAVDIQNNLFSGLEKFGNTLFSNGNSKQMNICNLILFFLIAIFIILILDICYRRFNSQ